ncbi:MAG TPA: acetate--CoA ligase [Dermatophilaceae bacterium]
MSDAFDSTVATAPGARRTVERPPSREPLIGDYEQRRRTFTWDEARRWVDGLPDGCLNIAHEAVDRHVAAGRGDQVALRFLDRTQPSQELTYGELRELTDAFAIALRTAGVRPGERVSTLLSRGPALYITALGTLKNGSVYCPLFPAFGPEPVRQRLSLGSVRVLVADTESYQRNVAPIRDSLPALDLVLIVGQGGEAGQGNETAGRPTPGSEGTAPWSETISAATSVRRRDGFTISPTRPEDPALLHFTSGTTGTPKGAVHVHEAVVAHHSTTRFALDLRPGDIFWCTADPGWVTGTSYGIIGPLTCGATVVTDAADFDAKRWYRILQEERVAVWYTAPTALRMLMRKGVDLAREYDLSALQHVISVGEPLNPEAVFWGLGAFNLPVHDTWWQTETGAIMISNYPGMPIRPGSMGRPMPGVEIAVLERGEDGRADIVEGKVRVVDKPGVDGELALRPGWPSMFRAYLDDPDRYAQAFADGWYMTGDVARIDEDGYVWFVGRADDVIKSAGHLVGPFEVESALMEHPAVAEVGVIGKPDPLAGEIVKAFVTLHTGYEPDEKLRRELIMFGRHRLGSVAPREIAFDQALPHTRSGKVMRRLLKARELGLPEGDLSTVEPPS